MKCIRGISGSNMIGTASVLILFLAFGLIYAYFGIGARTGGGISLSTPLLLSATTVIILAVGVDMSGVLLLSFHPPTSGPTITTLGGVVLGIGSAYTVAKLVTVKQVMPDTVLFAVIAVFDRLIDGTQMTRSYRRLKAGKTMAQLVQPSE